MDLDNLVRQQAKVGLINARDRLRQQSGAAPDGQAPSAIPTDGQGFSQQQAERIESSLGQADSENLELITRRIIQTQASAESSVAQIQVTMPIYGQVLRFDSPLQVEPAAEMAVAFTARPQRLARVDPSLWYGFGLFGVLLVCGAAVNCDSPAMERPLHVAAKCSCARRWLCSADRTRIVRRAIVI